MTPLSEVVSTFLSKASGDVVTMVFFVLDLNSWLPGTIMGHIVPSVPRHLIGYPEENPDMANVDMTTGISLKVIALLFCGCATAWAGSTQELSYDLVMNGAVVGKRDLTVRYQLPSDYHRAEIRLVEVWTEIDTRVAGVSLSIKNRSSGRMSTATSRFTSSVSINGDVAEYQGVMIDRGDWLMSAVINRTLHTWEHSASEIDLSSLDLFDPGRNHHFSDGQEIRILSAETGQITTCSVSDKGVDMITVEGQQTQVHRWECDAQSGGFELAWSDDGFLLEWKMSIHGQHVSARVRRLPPARNYGRIESVMDSPSVGEEDL